MFDTVWYRTLIDNVLLTCSKLVITDWCIISYRTMHNILHRILSANFARDESVGQNTTH